MKMVKWSEWSGAGMVNQGQIDVKEIDAALRRYAWYASYVFDRTGADHVVYGMKFYDAEGVLEEVRFYEKPMDDATFQRDVATMKNVVVYALHRGTAVARTEP